MRQIFVFGSNLAGRHGKGSALEAVRNHGAIYGVAIGLQGDSYAIPTKSEKLEILPLDVIAWHVEYFEQFAAVHCDRMTFDVVAIGCGLAGYAPQQIGPMFKLRPPNVNLPPQFQGEADGSRLW